MRRLWFLRHGRTAWNAERRLQGRADIPLDDHGRAAIKAYRLPGDVAALPAICSPLLRARETARLLGVASPTIEAALIEMDWGGWEGATVAELRARLGQRMQDNEDRGLDFRPEGGESPREVQDRLRPWLADMSRSGSDHFIVSHKGVIRALLALSHDWDMTGRAPVRLDFSALQGFDVDPSGTVRLGVPNRPLEARVQACPEDGSREATP